MEAKVATALKYRFATPSRCTSAGRTNAEANVVALSRSYFSRSLKHSVGLSPMEYVVVRRVERAKVMIRTTRESLAEVALACGFADQAHLNRRFRDVVGVSPGRWLRSNAAVPKPTPHRSSEVQATSALRRRSFAEMGCREFA